MESDHHRDGLEDVSIPSEASAMKTLHPLRHTKSDWSDNVDR